jgi:DNA repair photolyase
MEQLSSKGITTGVLMMPILPFLEDDVDNIKNIVEASHQCGAQYIYPGFGVTLRQNQRIHYLDKINELSPGLGEQYIKQYGTTYSCNSPRARELWHVFREECNRFGIAYRMADIISIIRKGYEYEQLSLFP